MKGSILHSIITLITLLPFSTYAQTSSNMTLQGTWDGSTSACVFGGTVCYNEVWGHVDGSGNEYAIICSPEEVHFVDITDPTNPTLKQTFTGTGRSIWRDLKSYGDYVYVVHDDNNTSNNEGLWIFDLSALPGGNIVDLGTLETDFGRAHNIFIDEPNARLYVAGSDTRSNGLLIYDISTPASPTLLANESLASWGGYVHDLYVRNHIAYCNSGYNGMWVYDFSDPNNPAPLGNTSTSGGYNHSSWMTDDSNYLVYAVETPDVNLFLVDVSDVPNNGIVDISNFKEALLAPTHEDNTAHNPLIKGDYLFVSYYEDGVQVWDISNPASPSLAAYYDMVSNSSYNGTDRGAWGVYPFLPSGNVLVSDDLTGLYVLRTSFPLPVELTEFKARAVNNNEVRLNWETRTEENNEKFVVERSADGQEFQAIGEVQGQGNSSSIQLYQFTDNRPLSGNGYYRLRQVDFNGQYAYSNVEQVFIEARGQGVSLYPNPIQFDNILQINWEDAQGAAITARVFHSNGTLLLETAITLEAGRASLELPTLSPGAYLLELGNEYLFHKTKFVMGHP